jgi:deoxyribonuclease V
MSGPDTVTPVSGRFVVVDVGYPPAGGAVGAAVVACDRRFEAVVGEHVVRLDDVRPYRPGALFERELPAVLAVLGEVGPVELVIVDGYVDLDPAGRPGLGAHVRRALDVPVIGVAKNRFVGATHAVAVRRGSSTRPLFVTSAGVAVADAAELVRDLAGDHRIPTALRRVDRLTRQVA